MKRIGKVKTNRILQMCCFREYIFNIVIDNEMLVRSKKKTVHFGIDDIERLNILQYT